MGGGGIVSGTLSGGIGNGLAGGGGLDGKKSSGFFVSLFGFLSAFSIAVCDFDGGEGGRGLGFGLCGSRVKVGWGPGAGGLAFGLPLSFRTSSRAFFASSLRDEALAPPPANVLWLLQ